jgi:4-amino-4-deoxy-L-arabinose transferase-like glycosyltransferase
MFFILGIGIYRAVMLYLIDPNLFFDEAYYWVWSQNFDWGYYSKPPMIAWMISLATSMFGDSSIVLKSISILIHPLTATVIYLITKTLFDEKTALYAGILFFTSPAVSLSSLIISTDVVLLFFWSLTLYMFILAVNHDKLIYWILGGILGGLGLLSKYNMILFIPSVFLYLIFSQKHRATLTNKNFYVTLILAMVVFLPNLIWNYNNEFISFVHLEEISQVEKELFHLDKLFEFLGAQFGVFGPVSFAVLLYLFAVTYRHKQDDKYMLLFWFTAIFLGVISLQAFLARAFANWAAPTYVSASILVAYFLAKHNKNKLFTWAITINILLMALLYHYEPIMKFAGVELSKKNDPYKRIRGWKTFGEKISEVYKEYPHHTLLADSRTEISEMIFYVKPHPFDTKIFNPQHRMQNYFHQTQDLNEHKGENFIYVSKTRSIKSVSKYFEKTRFIKKIKIKIHKDYSMNYYLYELNHFKGY